MTATKRDYIKMMSTSPERFEPDEVNYQEAPDGSAIRCCSCIRYLHRAIDGYGICEVVDVPEGDEAVGIRPDYRCSFQSVDGTSFPLLEAEE
jgi:hypothetical protein